MRNDIDLQLSKKTSGSRKEVYAVAIGCNVTFSGSHNRQHENWRLDNQCHYSHAWQARNNILGEWIQVGCQSPKHWTGAILQGRGNLDQWVKTVKFATTIDGVTWQNVQNGKVFGANSDCNAKVRIRFQEPVWARVLRIYPQTWHNAISLRFDATFLEPDP